MPDSAPDALSAPAEAADDLVTERSVGGELVYAIGDVHGRYDLLKALLEQIWRDVAHRAAGRTPVLIVCGDFIDRGPQSAEVIDALNWLHRRSDIRLHVLKGNHEQTMLEFMQRPERAGAWLSFGGAETLMSYGVAPPDRTDAAALARTGEALLDRLPASHMMLLQRLQMVVTIGDYAFVHAGVRPGVALAHQLPTDLMWIREGFLDFDGPHERFIVHGHSWTDPQPQLGAHRLGIDTGAYATGVLTAVRLEDFRMAFLQTGGDAAA